jgi:molybdopterin/thiamine biosynthesis adenylyltransferase
MVKISADNEPVKNKDDAYFANFDIVCALTTDLAELEFINKHCRAKNVLFLSGFVYGYSGFTFVDFGDYKYLV